MKRTIITITLALIMITALGCQESAKVDDSPKVETASKMAIQKVLDQWKDAYTNNDIDAIMALYSEDFYGPQGEDKQAIRQLLEDMDNQGYFQGMEFDISEAEIQIEGQTATVTPVTYSGEWGQVQYESTFKIEGNKWKIVESGQYY